MVGSAQPFCLSRQKPNGSRCNITMNLGKSEITAPHNNTGLDDQISSGRAGTVFLDIPFYRTGFSVTAIGGSGHIPESRLVGGPPNIK